MALIRIVRPEAGWTTAAPKVGSGSCLDPSVYTHSSGFHAGHQGTKTPRYKGGGGGVSCIGTPVSCCWRFSPPPPPPVCEGTEAGGMELARPRLRKRGGAGAGRKAWGAEFAAGTEGLRDRVDEGDVSVGLPGFAGLDCFGGQTGGADMGDKVCKSHVIMSTNSCQCTGRGGVAFAGQRGPRLLCYHPPQIRLIGLVPYRIIRLLQIISSWNSIMPGPGRPFFTLNACEPGKAGSTPI